ncbi:MAG: NAD(P)-dependent oxidoreductase, partial [Acetobacteraceae bacterium]
MSKPLLLLWTDGAEPYARAIEEAGLAARLRVETVPRAATPDDALLAEAEALLSWGPPPGILARMPKLRFVQALTAGVEHWLSRPDLAPDVALACARGTHRVQMPENILGALFHITKPYAAIAADNAARRWTRRVSATLAGSTLGILGLGAIGAELARKAQALEMRVIGTKRSP